METTVTTLLRDFPRVRRAALAGEVVIIRSREGTFRFSLDQPVSGGIVGCLPKRVETSADDLDRPTSVAGEWESDG